MLKFCCILILITAIECEMEGYIVGGDFADIEWFPHSAFLSITCIAANGKKDVYMCGSSILNQDILLTAAHCVSGCSTLSEITASVGHVNKHEGSMSSVLSVLIHGNYDENVLVSDIALLRLTTRLKLSQKVGRVALMKKPPYKAPAEVAGWGLIDEINTKFADDIKYIDQKVMRSKDCKKIIKNKPVGTICAKGDYEEEYPSRGDSGSALVVRGYIQIGVVSFKMMKIARHVIVYTDVGYYYKWIRRNSRKLYCLR